MRKINPELHERLNKLIAVLGYELVGCEILSGGRQGLFRIYIDSLSKEHGITVEDCSRVSHQVSAVLDVEDPLSGHYNLEISSPGINRPLFELEHYKKYIGSRVKIKLFSPIEQRKHYKGKLQRVEGENIYLLVDEIEQEVELPFSIIEKGNLIADIHL